jgi:hypothetical protein
MAHDGKSVSADPTTTIDVLPFAGRPVPVTPTGPAYQPTSPDDEVGLYLLALHMIPGPHTITGTPPQVPDLDTEVPAGATP